MTTEMLTATRSNPFPGLRPFEFDESHLFFGRDGQSEQVLRKLSATRFVAIVGTSGSGKSSLARAGLLPELYGGMMPSAGSNWRVAIVRPGNDPLGELARKLNAPDVFGSEHPENAKLQATITEATLRRGSLGLIEAVQQAMLPASENLLVLVDQFEELFRFAKTAKNDSFKNEAAAFVKLLLEASRQREVNIYVVLTMRSDFLGDCAMFRDLPEAINEGQYLVPRLTRDQLRAAITGPLAVAGATITPRLLDRLLNDVGDDQDQLPVLQHALMRMWDEWERELKGGNSTPSGSDAAPTPHSAPRTPHSIDLRHYEAIGGMAEALSRHADEAYDGLPDERHRLIAEKLFKCLTEKGDDNREIRRPVTLKEICAVAAATEPEAITVINAFRQEGRSFLTPPEKTRLHADSLIDISHESLIRVWSKLRNWVVEEAQSARTYQRLAVSAVAHRDDEEDMLQGTRLRLDQEWQERTHPNEAWAQRYHPEFALAMNFLEKSRVTREQEVAAEEKRRKKELHRAQLIAAVFALAFLAGIALASYANAQRKEALAQGQEAVRQKEIADQKTRAAQKAERSALDEKGIAEQKTQEAEDARQQAQDQAAFAEEQKQLAENLKLQAEKKQHEAQAQRQRAEEGESLSRRYTYVANLTLAQKALEAGDFSKEDYYLLQHAPVSKLNDADFHWRYLMEKKNDSYSLAEENRTGGDTIFGAMAGNVRAEISSEKIVRLWDLESGQGVKTFALGRSDGLTYSANGKYLANRSNDGITLWDLVRGVKLNTFPPLDRIRSLVFSADESKLAVLYMREKSKIWDIKSGTELTALEEKIGVASSLIFSADGTKLISRNTLGERKLWEVGSATQLQVAGTFFNTVGSVVFNPDGTTLAGRSTTGKIQIWDVASGAELHTFQGVNARLAASVVFSADGTKLAGQNPNGNIQIWDVASGAELRTLSVTSTFFVFSADGTKLASRSADGVIQIWDLLSGNEVRRSRVAAGFRGSFVFSPDGTKLASFSTSETILWDVTQGKIISRRNGHSRAFFPSATSAGSVRPISVSIDQTIKLQEVTSGKILTQLTGHAGSINSLVFNATGTKLASRGVDQTIKIWEVTTGELLHTLSMQTSIVTSNAFSTDGKQLASGSNAGADVAFSTDGKQLASGGNNGAIKLWDVISGKELFVLPGNNNPVTSVAFSFDNKMLASGDNSQTIKLWDVSQRKMVHTLDHTGIITAVAFSADGKQLASGSDDYTIKLWDVKDGKQLWSLKGEEKPIKSFSFIASNVLLSTDLDGRSTTWDLAKLEKPYQRVITTGKSDPLWMSFLTSGKTLATITDKNTIELQDITGQPKSNIIQLPFETNINAAELSPNGKFLAINPEGLKIYELTEQGKLLPINLKDDRYTEIEFSPLSTRFGVYDGKKVSVFDARTKQQLWSFKQSDIFHFDFWPDEETLAVVSETGRIEWRQKGKIVKIVQLKFAQSEEITSTINNAANIDFSPDGKTIVAHLSSNEIKLWNINKPNESKKVELEGRQFENSFRAFSPDSKILAIGVNESRNFALTYLVDVQTGQVLAKLNRQKGQITSIDFAPDGQTLAVRVNEGSTDGMDFNKATIYLYLAATDEEVNKAIVDAKAKSAREK